MKKKTMLLLSMILSLLVFIYNTTLAKNNNNFIEEKVLSTKKEEELRVHFLDIGQGDSIFIELPNNETMLIDGGEKEYGTVVKNYIESLGYNRIDYLIGTHPHTDHIGSFENIINSLNINSIYMPKVVSNTKTYENLLKAILNKNHKVKKTFAGEYIINTDDLKILFKAPNSETYEDLNNYSAVVYIEYRNNNFIFMGDAEIYSEKEIKDLIKTNVIKIGHHGSNTSSSKEFVEKISADIGVISVGKDNIYNLPKNDIISRWEKKGTKIYRTDLSGNIVITSDGNNITVVTEDSK